MESISRTIVQIFRGRKYLEVRVKRRESVCREIEVVRWRLGQWPVKISVDTHKRVVSLIKNKEFKLKSR